MATHKIVSLGLGKIEPVHVDPKPDDNRELREDVTIHKQLN